jgi:hypothetical protein
MNFKQATNALLESVTLDDLAQTMGVSVQAVRQARADERTEAFRSPPAGWERATWRLAEAQARHFTQLAKKLSSK